jgi:hypothetical protein
MFAWLNNGLAMKKNQLPVLCNSCPCTTGIFPGVKEVFPFWDGMGDYGIGWTNSRWEVLTVENFEPRSQTWQNPPFVICSEAVPDQAVAYLGFSYPLWQNSYGGNDAYTGAKQEYAPSLGVALDQPYYYNVFVLPTSNPADGHNIRFEFTSVPEKLAGSSRFPYPVKPDADYSFTVYDEDNGDEVIFQGKIVVSFACGEIHITDIDNPDIDVYAYPITFSALYARSTQTATYSIYDSDNNLVYSGATLNESPELNISGCVPDVDFSVIGRCDYSKRDCLGCLTDTSLKVCSDSIAAGLDGRCINGKNIYHNYSYHYSLIASGFETQSDAQDYIESNYEALISGLQSACAKDPWHIIGYCKCPDDTCGECVAQTDNIFTICVNDIKNCFESNGEYFKHTVLANSREFGSSVAAEAYIAEHLDELKSELNEACPACIDGKYYGIHYLPYWHDSINGGNCRYGYPYPVVWSCGEISYYTSNPLEFEADYGEGATWEIAAGPFDSMAAADAAIKSYTCKTTQWTAWHCVGTTNSADIVLTFFATPSYSGGDTCVGGTYGYHGCSGYGSRKGPYEIILNQ